MTFPDDNQTNLALAAIRGECFVSPLTGRHIRGYLVISADVSVPITTIGFNDGSVVVEFEVGTPPTDTPLPVELDVVGSEEFRNAIFESAWGAGKGAESGSLPVTDSLADLSSSHEGEV